MTTTHTLSVPKRTLDADKLGFFRFGALGDGYLLTNDCGQWQHVDSDTFTALLAGEITEDHDAYDDLRERGFLRASVDLDTLSEALRARKRFIGMGPRSHVIRLTDGHGALSVETAKDIIDHVMLSTSRDLDFDLVSGAGPVDADLLKFIVQYATEKNRYEGKTLTYRLISTLKTIDAETAKWLVTKRFAVQTIVDGDAKAHDALRRTTGAATHADVTATIAQLHEAAAAKNREGWSVAAEVHIGTPNVGDPAGLIKALTDAGLSDVHVRPILSGDDAITPAAFATFYAAFIEGLAALGGGLTDGVTNTLLTRMLRTEASSDVSVRSPSAQGTGQLVYDTAGHIFPSDDARVLHAEQEDEMFLLGTAGITSYKEHITHPTVRALTLASLVEGLPGFNNQWFAPFIGLDPVGAYVDTGDLFTTMPTSAWVAVQVAMLETLFAPFVADDADRVSIFESWIS